MASESDKLARDARDLILALRKVTPIVLFEAARLVGQRNRDQSISPSGVDRLFEQLTLLGWDGVSPRQVTSGNWRVVTQCKVCLNVVRSDPVPSLSAARSCSASFLLEPSFHSEFQLSSEELCHGLLEVLGLSR
jgi:hypothetical protein